MGLIIDCFAGGGGASVGIEMALGHTVFNPASVNSKLPKGTTYEEYMKVSFYLIEMAEAIYMMDKWEDSKGAIRELLHAKVKGKEILFEVAGPDTTQFLRNRFERVI